MLSGQTVSKIFKAIFIVLAMSVSVLSVESVFARELSGDDLTGTASGHPVGGPFIIADQPVDTIYPALAYNSIWEQYLVVWENDRPILADLYAQLLDNRGNPVGGWKAVPEPVPGQNVARRRPAVAHNLNFNEYLVVYEYHDLGTGAISIRAQRTDDYGAPVGNEIQVSSAGPVSGFKPKVAHAFSAGYYLVVWESHTQGNPSNDIVGQLVSSDGNLSGGNFTIAQGTLNYSQAVPDLAYNRRRNEFLVAWQQEDKNASLYDIYARIVRPDGSMPPGAIEIARYTSSSTHPAVGAIPTAHPEGLFMVVYVLDSAPGNHDIMGKLIDGLGNIVLNNFYIAVGGVEQYQPAVAGSENRQEFLVTWNQDWLPPVMSSTVWGRSVSPDGTSLGRLGEVGGIFANNPAVSSGYGGDYLVVYDDTVPGYTNRDVWGRLWGDRAYLPAILKNWP